MFGKCMNYRREKLHLKLFKEFMNSKKYHYGYKCRFYNPIQLRLKDSRNFHDKNVHERKYPILNNPYSYAQIVKKNSSPFFEQTPPLKHPIISQEINTNSLFSGREVLPNNSF